MKRNGLAFNVIKSKFPEKEGVVEETKDVWNGRLSRG